LKDPSIKWAQRDLRFLFVGREAHRKGLPATLKAIVPLLNENPRMSFTIVSSLDDGYIEIPDLPNLRLLRETDRAEVLRLMAESHILTMPSSWESYGFVYVEAMSQACVPMALDRPIQRELIGENGILVSAQNSDEIHSTLKHVMATPDVYFAKALKGLESFRTRHAPEKVAAQFHAALANV
jgi:glycosyltransferase involved in cell wall biosynthesis